MTPRCLLIISLLSFGLSSKCWSTDVSTAQRPNIVLIMADDLGYECIGINGSTQYQTPHLDQIASKGMRFIQCHAQPLCTPTRVKLMTGLSNARNYAAFSILPRDQKTIGQHFKQAGYRTCVAGKWQLYGAEHYSPQFREKGTLPEQAGFESTCLWQVDKSGSRFFAPLMYVDGKNIQFSDDQYGPQVATDYILKFMEQKRKEAFFVYYPMILTHSPFVPTPLSKSPSSKDKQKNFADMVHYMDFTIGRIVNKVKELGLAENTLIMFVGDNGTHTTLESKLGERVVRGGKGKTTNAGTHVPMVAYWPGVIEPGEVNDKLIDMSDFLPTCLAACSIEATNEIDGLSFFHQLIGKPGIDRKWIYCYYNPRPERTEASYFIRDTRYKLYGDERFYDLKVDHLENSPITQPKGDALKAFSELRTTLDSLPTKGKKLLQFPR